MIHPRLGFAVIAFASALMAAPLPAASLVWRIGMFDGSSDEFSPRTQGPHALPFDAGRSYPAEDWPAFQAVARPGSSPQEVAFNLERAPAQDECYHLKIAVLFETASIPAVDIRINGRRGRFYFHPQIDNRMGDAAAGNRTGYSRGDLNVDFPGAYLQAGRNDISFEPVAASPESVPDAGFTYDALELTRQDEPFDRARLSVNVEPTIFFKTIEGRLHEVLQVILRYGARTGPGTITVALAGGTYRQPLAGGQDLGEERLELPVQEFQGPTSVTSTLRLGGRTETFATEILPRKKWTVFVIPHVHLDIGYTDVQAKVGALQARILDQAMDLADEHPGFVYTTDGSWCVEEFMQTRGPADQRRLVQAIKDGRIFVPANYCSLLTGFPTAETLIRSLYYSANFSRKFGTPLNYATMTDAPSYTWSYPSVLAAAGIPYFLGGSNNDRGPILLKSDLRERSPMQWNGPDGQGVKFWYARVYRQVHMLFGLPPIVDAGREMLPVFLQTYDSPLYRSDAILLYGTQGENRELFPEQAELVGKWNKLYAYPRLQYSGVKDAMVEIERRGGGVSGTVSGDGGPYWEDDIPANPIHAALERKNESRGPSAEKFATIAALANPTLAVNRDALTDMWRQMVLYDEHNCLAPDAAEERNSLKGIDMIAVKNAYAVRADQLAHRILQNSLASLADSISADRGSLIVFNSLNWPRSGEVTVDLSDGDEIVDTVTRKVVAIEALGRGHNFTRARFTAENIPGLGYKVFVLHHSAHRARELAHGANLAIEDMIAGERAAGPTPALTPPPNQSPASPVTSTTMESPFYRVALDAGSGSILSVYDKQLQRELVDSNSPYRFGQYLYVTGGDMPLGRLNGLLQYAKAPPALTVHGSGNGRIVSIVRTPYGWSAHLESTGFNTPRIATEVRLFEREKKIELVVNLTKQEVYRREGVYFAFPFAMKQATFTYEIQNGWVDPAKDMLPGAGLDWFSVQHWISVEQPGLSASVFPLDAPLASFGDIIRGVWSSKFGSRPGAIFSNVVNNYHVPRALIDLPARPVADALSFRYVITSDVATNPQALSRMGWEEMTPLAVNEIQAQDQSWIRPRPLAAQQGSFLECADPHLLLTTWKPAEDGDGTILRFLDLGGAPRRATVRIPLLNLEHVHLTDALERDGAELPTENPHQFEFEVGPHRIISVRVTGPSALHRAKAVFQGSLGR